MLLETPKAEGKATGPIAVDPLDERNLKYAQKPDPDTEDTKVTKDTKGIPGRYNQGRLGEGTGEMTTTEVKYHTSGIVPLTRPQLVGTLTGLLLAALLAAIDQTIVGTAEPRIIASALGLRSLSVGRHRLPADVDACRCRSSRACPTSTAASRSSCSARRCSSSTSALCGAAGKLTFLPIDGMGQLILFRGLQGIGAGMVMGLLFTIVGDIFSPIGARPLSGSVRRRLGRRVDLRSDARRLAHRPVVVARLLLGQPAGRRHRGGRDLLRVPAHEAARFARGGSTGPGSRR